MRFSELIACVMAGYLWTDFEQLSDPAPGKWKRYKSNICGDLHPGSPHWVFCHCWRHDSIECPSSS